MKAPYLAALAASVLLGGCSREQTSSANLTPDAKLTARESLEKIQNDPNMPEGLKRIKAETLQRQPGAGR